MQNVVCLRSSLSVLRSSFFVLRCRRWLSRFGFDAVAAGVSDAQYMLSRAEVSSLIFMLPWPMPPVEHRLASHASGPLLAFLDRAAGFGFTW